MLIFSIFSLIAAIYLLEAIERAYLLESENCRSCDEQNIGRSRIHQDRNLYRYISTKSPDASGQLSDEVGGSFWKFLKLS